MSDGQRKHLSRSYARGDYPHVFCWDIDDDVQIIMVRGPAPNGIERCKGQPPGWTYPTHSKMHAEESCLRYNRCAMKLAGNLLFGLIAASRPLPPRLPKRRKRLYTALYSRLLMRCCVRSG